jgi:predicted amidohydrolase YtcJ
VGQDGRVWTGDQAEPWAEAVAITGDRITAVGSRTEVARWIGPETQVLSAAGGMITPGFIDTHVHLVDGGASLASVQLRDAANPAEFSRRIAEFTAEVEPGEWILAGAWDHENWGGEVPHRKWIGEATRNNPVAVARLDGHMVLANSRALELAGIDQATPEVEGGTIVRDADGAPTGILKDNAMTLVLDVIPPPSPARLDRQIDAAQSYLIENGITTAHDMGEWSHLEAYRRARVDLPVATVVERQRSVAGRSGTPDASICVGHQGGAPRCARTPSETSAGDS